jgi:hypothetical protein
VGFDENVKAGYGDQRPRARRSFKWKVRLKAGPLGICVNPCWFVLEFPINSIYGGKVAHTWAVGHLTVGGLKPNDIELTPTI